MNIKIGKKNIGFNKPSYIIAEIGINHEGNLQKCKNLVASAKRAGADAVKLQTIIPEENYIKGSSSYRIFKKAFLDKKKITQIFKFSKKLKLDIFSTSTDKDMLNFIDGLDPIAHKISSSSLTNIPLIEHTAKKKKPIFVSTGMADKKDIENAVNTIKKTNNKKIILMYCVSLYPTPKKNLNYPRGFSKSLLPPRLRGGN